MSRVERIEIAEPSDLRASPRALGLIPFDYDAGR
jgi:hypothetical protein